MFQYRLSSLVCLGSLLALACAEDEPSKSREDALVEAGAEQAEDESSEGEDGDRDDAAENDSNDREDDSEDDPREDSDTDDSDSDSDDSDSDDSDSDDSDGSDSDDDPSGERDDDDGATGDGDDAAEDDSNDADEPREDDATEEAEGESDESETTRDDALEPEESEERDDATRDAGAEPTDEDDSSADEGPAPSLDAGAGDAGEPAVEDEEQDCPAGYVGIDCGMCARGYVADGEECVEACIALDCGDHGSCTVGDDLSASCECDEGFAGESCDECAPGYHSVRTDDGLACSLDAPSTSDMVVWLDADHDDSFEYGSDGEVWRWHSRAGDDTFFSDGGVSSARPERVMPTRGSRNWVRFDGVDDRLRRVVDLSGSYSIFMVVKASSEESTQILLSGVDIESGSPGLRVDTRAFGTELMARHQMPFGDDYDQVNVEDYDLTGGGIVHVERNTTLGALGVWNGSSLTATAATTPAFGGEILLQLGALVTDGEMYNLDGDIAELIIFSPALASTAEFKEVRDYLNAKWDL